MLKKVMALLASKYLAIKVRIRAVETHLAIQSLLLRDKKMIQHLFRQQKCFNISNKVKDEDEYQSESINALINKVEDEDYLSESIGACVDCSVATSLINSSIATTPVCIVQVAKGAEDKMEREEKEEDCDNPDSRYSLSEDQQEEYQCVSVIEMAKNAKERRGKKFVLEDDIDKVADLFIQRFHHQIRSEAPF